jgi:iron(III) transport system ATP-binding protein
MDLSPPPPPVVELRAITKRYQQPAHLAVEDLTLDVAAGEILCLLGPSGCGKTTLLRLIAGFETPDEGHIRIAGLEVAGPTTWVPPDRRRIGFVFQDYALFPHLTVLQNVAFGLRGSRRSERERRAAEVLDLVGLTIFSGRYPHQLSGGQQQRVALARALAPQPAVILLDEPFSNLDAALRGATRDEVRQILKRTGATTVLVTHDQEEALTFADRIAVMRAGHLEQVGAPEAVYLRPRTAFVASFLGRTNLLRGEAHGAHAQTGLGDVALARAAKGQVILSVRPEALAFDPGGAGVPVRVLQRDFKGHDLTFTCQSTLDPTLRLIVQTGPECTVREGDVVPLALGGSAVPLEGSGKRTAGTA